MAEQEQIWIRMPSQKKGDRSICPITGLSRPVLHNLCVPCKANKFKPKVKSITVSPTGKDRGTRLISQKSLLSYLAKLEQEEAKKAEQQAKEHSLATGEKE